MKAAVLYEANTPLQIVDLQQQGPQAGEARVRVKAAGVCHSDWHIMNGDWPLPLPMVLGHEAAGIVEEVGPGVANVKPGDHVIFSFRPQCGRCLYCSLGRSILCDGHKSVRWAMLEVPCIIGLIVALLYGDWRLFAAPWALALAGLIVLYPRVRMAQR